MDKKIFICSCSAGRDALLEHLKICLDKEPVTLEEAREQEERERGILIEQPFEIKAPVVIDHLNLYNPEDYKNRKGRRLKKRKK